MPRAEPPTDPDSLRNGRHRKIAAILVVVIFVIALIGSALDESSADIDAPTSVATVESDTSDIAPEQSAVLRADYDEGFKAGYVDGRSAEGKLADSYAPPATSERRSSYADGYLEGFKRGCDEGNFDCSAALQQLETQSDATYQ